MRHTALWGEFGGIYTEKDVSVRGAVNVAHEVVVNRACQEIVPVLRGAFRAAGLRVEQSFDLRSALADVPACTCPHHGTSRCDCQYNVLLVYGQAGVPVSVIVHGHDARSWITLVDYPAGGAAAELVAQIMQTLAVLLRSGSQQAQIAR